MDESKNKIKEVVKIVAKSLGTTLLIVALVLSIVLVFLGGALYYLTVDEGIYKEGDWSSVPYGASQFMNGTSVDDEGNIKSNMSSQELRDKLIKNKSKVADYLQGPKDLARMMKAEMVTKYPDLRPHPDAAINWEEVWENDDMTQGIIKFKRAKDDGNTVTMSYVKPDVFQSYIDEYNKNGSAVAKNNALTHFTLKENYSASGPVVKRSNAHAT